MTEAAHRRRRRSLRGGKAALEGQSVLDLGGPFSVQKLLTRRSVVVRARDLAVARHIRVDGLLSSDSASCSEEGEREAPHGMRKSFPGRAVTRRKLQLGTSAVVREHETAFLRKQQTKATKQASERGHSRFQLGKTEPDFRPRKSQGFDRVGTRDGESDEGLQQRTSGRAL